MKGIFVKDNTMMTCGMGGLMPVSACKNTVIPA